jgi:hypothetical protein
MSASVKYWRLPEEEREFIEYLNSIEPTVALIPDIFLNLEDPEWEPLEQAFARDASRYLITPARFVSQARVLKVNGANGNEFKVDVVASPVLFYYRGRMIAPNRLSSTALSADWSYLTEDQRTMEDKPADFVRWAKRVMQWVRRVAPGWHQHRAHRITAKAEAARRAGLELIS